MKHDCPFAWMMAIAIASMTMTACSSDSNEPAKPFTTDPVEQVRLFACEPVDETRAAAIDTLFTEDDIEWFNVSTREIRFKAQDERLFNKLMKNYHHEGLEFRLGESILFIVNRFVSDIDSRIFLDLVLHYSTIGDDEGNPRYYLHDCYPQQFINDERTQANIKQRAGQWELFTHYLESKGKLRK
ncbi:MAG: hypothetical protein K6B13_01015 [Prevotella sp.]|nr:hypothetical protein [Prevotella sp.]